MSKFFGGRGGGRGDYESEEWDRQVQESQQRAARPENEGAGMGSPPPYDAYGPSNYPAPTGDRGLPARLPDVPITTLARDTAWNGTLKSQGNVAIEGQVEGFVEAAQLIFIAEEARVRARVLATDVTVAGLLEGDIICENRVEITATGRVQGTIRTTYLVVQDGGTFDGRIEMNAENGRGRR